MSNLRRMYILSFLFTFTGSLSAYINSSYLATVIPTVYVGIIYTISSLVTLFLLSESADILKHLGNKKFIITCFFINMLGLAGLITSADPYIIGLSFVAFAVTNTLVFFCIDIFIQHFGVRKAIGKIRGLYLTIINCAWIISPLVTARIVTHTGYQAIYIVALIATATTTLGLIFSVRHFIDQTYTKLPFKQAYEYLKKNTHILAITVINFILQFFFAWMVVYTPLYLSKYIGFGWDKIGIIFTIMLLPFVLFGLPIGILIDKYHVSKKTLLLLGLLILSLSAGAMSFITVPSVALWALILFLTRFGAAIIETTSEIYFFTHVEEKDAYLLGVFRDMTPVAYIIAPLIATLFFEISSIKYLFILLGAIILTGLHYINKLRETNGLIPDQNQ